MDKGRRNLGTLLVLTLLMISQIPLAFAGQWIAVGTAPSAVGVYNVVIRATYSQEGIIDTHPLTLWVRAFAETPEELLVQPWFQQDITPPISLRYNITVNNTPVEELVSSNITVEFFAPDDSVIYTRAPPLEPVAGKPGLFTAIADVPFEGNYNALIGVKVLYNDEIYEGSFMTEFYADSPSENLGMNTFVREKLFAPGDDILVYANMSFYGQELGGVNIFRAQIFEDQTSLVWDDLAHIYWGGLTAPEEEGKYDLIIFAVRQGYLNVQRVYVIDLSKTKARACPITPASSSCNDETEVRKCFEEYQSAETFISEAQMMNCAETGFLKPVPKVVVCEDRKGDLDGDLQLDVDDVELLQNVILPLPQDDRDDYAQCADYDHDGDVDEDDQVCLANVLSGKWGGNMNGGFCFDVKTESPLAGDLDGNKIIDGNDNLLIEMIIEALQNHETQADIRESAGEDLDQIEPFYIPSGMLKITDFNLDDDIDDFDQECLKSFVGARLGDSQTLVPLSEKLKQGRLSRTCFNIYRLDRCWDIRGDVNGDLLIDERDELLTMMARRGLLLVDDTGGRQGVAQLSCVDVNEDGFVTEEDELCVKAYVEGDFDEYYLCIGCQEDMPNEFYHSFEVCGDNYDNNCDGLTDRTDLDRSKDWCNCGPQTPCWVIKDGTPEGPDGINDGEVQLCRWMSSPFQTQPGVDAPTAEETGYRWIDWQDAMCTQDRQCTSMACNDYTFRCTSEDGTTGKWQPYCDMFPENEYRRCEDGWDNDCIGGDEECEEEAGTTGMVVAGVAAAAVGYLGGPIISMAFNTAGQFLFPEYSQGFMWGGMLGGLAGSLGTPYSYSEAGPTKLTDAGQKALKDGKLSTEISPDKFKDLEPVTQKLYSQDTTTGNYVRKIGVGDTLTGADIASLKSQSLMKTDMLGAVRNPTASIFSGGDLAFNKAGGAFVDPTWGSVIGNVLFSAATGALAYGVGEIHDVWDPDKDDYALYDYPCTTPVLPPESAPPSVREEKYRM